MEFKFAKHLSLTASKSGKPLILRHFLVSHKKHKGKRKSSPNFQPTKSLHSKSCLTMTFPCMKTKSAYHSKTQAVKTALQNHLENPISDNQFKT